MRKNVDKTLTGVRTLVQASGVRKHRLYIGRNEERMARQQKLKFEEMEVSDMSISNSAMVHGVSPVKCNRTKAEVKHFEGQLSDGKKTVRMVWFEPKLRAEVEQARVSGEGVAVTNCCVQESKKPGCEALEIVAGNRTTVVKSPKKYRIGEDVRRGDNAVDGHDWHNG